MAYTTFSTDNADYVLQLGNHKFRNKQVDIFEGIDALVIETGKSRFKEIVEHGHQQYDLPLKHCLENSIPIFGTDVRGTSSGYQRNLFSNTITGFPTWIPLAYYGLSEKRINSLMLSIFANYSFLIQDNRNEGRNAINARKIEEFVVPLMAGRERKPSIGLIFGAAHMGIKTNLQSKRRRDFSIWNWRNLNFGKWAGFIQEDLNLVQEANYNGKEWEIQTYTANLFD